MENNEGPLQTLLLHAEQYGKTSIELLKMKTIDKVVDVASTFISRTLLAIIAVFFALTLTIALSLWLGDVLGKTYYGFLVMASVYALVGLILFFFHPTIKSKMTNSILAQMLN